MNTAHTTVSSGIGLGAALAVVLSYTKWHSIAWAIVHGVVSWFYVLYFGFTYGW